MSQPDPAAMSRDDLLALLRQLQADLPSPDTVHDRPALPRAVADHLPGVVFQAVRGPDGRYQFNHVSAAIELLTGIPVDDLTRDAAQLSAALLEDDRLRVAAALAAAPAVLDLEFRLRHRNGGERWAQLRAAPRSLPDGSVVWDGMLLDVTERHRTEDERQRLERQQQEAQRQESLGVLAGGIAHDFNNLLTIILGYLNLGMCELPPGAEVTRMLREVERAAHRAAELTQQMLAYAGRSRFVPQAIDLSALVREQARELQTLVPPPAILTLDLADDLPAIVADAAHLRQVLASLVVNAAEALPRAPAACACAPAGRNWRRSIRTPRWRRRTPGRGRMWCWRCRTPAAA